MFKILFRTKPLGIDAKTPSELHRCLTAFDLTLLGIGAIIGAGIFVLTGIAAATRAGPAVVLSYLVAGLASTFSALSYAELAASIGGCGSAYGYAFAGLGEFVAWIIGWDLLLEYGMSCSTVAIGWSGYAENALTAIGIHIPVALSKDPASGGIVNLPAMIIILTITALLAIGVRHSTRFNNIIVFIKLLVIAIFIGVASFHINPSNWHPFLPFGWHGIISGAALIFFAYIGFDAVSTAAEEAIDPHRTLPIGIISSVIICTLIYIIVAALLTSIVPYTTLNVSSPVANALLQLQHPAAAAMVAAGAIAGLTTVMLVMFYGLTRVFLAIARDGLLPQFFAALHPRTRTPVTIIVLSGIVIATIAGVMPIKSAAELVNIGTLAAFALVCGGVVILFWKKPNLPRPFKTPLTPLVPLLGALACFYLMLNLPAVTWLRFFIWLGIGMLIYFGFSIKRRIWQHKNAR